MTGDSSAPSGTSPTTHNSFATGFPSPNLAHQLPVKLTSSNFLLWKRQFLPMIKGCGLDYHIEGDEVIPERLLDNNQPNPAYSSWVREDQLALSWIAASVSEGILPQLVGAETARKAWTKLVTAFQFKATNSRAKGISYRFAALQHPISNTDLVEFVLARLGPTYHPFTRSLESRQEEISFYALYRLLLNEEQQLKGDEALTVIAPTAQFTHSSFTLNRGRGRGGRCNRGHGRYQNQGFSQLTQNRASYQPSNPIPSDMPTIICHNCEGKGHVARDSPSPKTPNGTRISGRPDSNLASTQSSPTQNWSMDSGTTHHLTSDLDNLAIHSEYQGPEEVTLGLGNKGNTAHRPE
ncbi:hypothetical protein KY290_017021 [Solanum tuberosum]|uniref:Retrotransposon Copia-like N-terminal domain-containing protein n=1 Tax=Solanum tuberosum TaxID=4113 RepID=A0ABQ7VAY5_SOLTU|nr:hypothetical protein KY284_016092 [Solanum tuberosum]KAH0760948.1 hypothetical protein KY290_017021 [Solanum tuberosum]